MATRNGIEIGFDEESGGYYAVWHPPVAIGSGESMAEAVCDMREAVELCMKCHVDGVLREINEEA